LGVQVHTENIYFQERSLIMADHDDFGTFLVGFIVGGLTGAIVSLLFAPQTGEQTRTLIKDKAIELYDMASDTVEDSMTQAQDAANDAVKRAEILLKQAQDKANEVEKQGKILLEKQTAKPAEPKARKAAKSGTSESEAAS
jgi:gas vesicle protein